MLESAARLSVAIEGERGEVGDAEAEVDAETSWLKMGDDGDANLVDVLLLWRLGIEYKQLDGK